jgi:hypothetical protein
MKFDDVVTCPGCGQDYTHRECFIGTLGKTTHYRCRGCGVGFSRVELDPIEAAARLHALQSAPQCRDGQCGDNPADCY